METPYAVVFAGIPGTSKTPISHYLSCEFSLPIFSTDQIRFEVREDLRLANINRPGGVEEFEKRFAERFDRLLAAQVPVIIDGSSDRKWSERKLKLTEAGYGWYMISMELTKNFLLKLYADTGRSWWADDNLDPYLQQHEEFLHKFKADIDVEIHDDNFGDRLQVAADGLKKFLEDRAAA